MNIGLFSFMSLDIPFFVRTVSTDSIMETGSDCSSYQVGQVYYLSFGIQNKLGYAVNIHSNCSTSPCLEVC